MPTEEWTPALADVGALLRARTKDTNGNELGTFTADTRPTADEVTNLINKAVSRLAGRIGTDPCNAELVEDAQGVAGLYAAMLVELSYFPEQIKTGQSPYTQLKELYDDDVKSLIANVGEQCGGSTVEGGGGQSPTYDFEKPVAPIGFGVNW